MNHTKAILYGIAIWAAVFIVALLAFPLRQTERPLFESIMPVALAIATVIASVRYFRSVKECHFVIGWCLGLIWLAVNVAIDLPLFMQGFMKMTLADYVKDIAVTYLMIPVITAGYGYVLRRRMGERG